MNEKLEVLVIGVLIGGLITIACYEFYYIPEERKKADDFWLDYIYDILEIKDHPLDGWRLSLGGKVAVITDNNVKYTLGVEGKYTCVYEGNYEEGKDPIFKSISATEAINWALNH